MSLLLLSLCFAFAASDPTVTLSGRVVDADGRPAAGVELFLSDGPPINPRVAVITAAQVPVRPKIVARALCDDSGTFTIGLPDETPESSWARTWLVLWAHRPGSAVSTHLIGRDGPTHAAPVEMRLTEAPGLKVVVESPEGKPFERARVSPEQVNHLRLPQELAERLASITDAAGGAVLRDVALADLELLRVETVEYGVQWASLPAHDVDSARRIVLSPVGALRGRLTADEPRAVAAVKVRMATWLAAGDELAGGGLAEATTDAEGHFEVPAIAAGALSAACELHADLPFRCRRITGRPLVEGAANELTINLERAVRVEGVVRDRDSGEPLGGAEIWLDLQSSPSDAPRSSADGRYSSFVLPGQTSPWPWRLARHYYFPQYTLDTQPVPEGVAPVELKPLLLVRGATVRGRVVDRNRQSVAAAEIEGHWELASGGEYSAHAWSDRDGGFTLDGIDPQAQLKLSASSAQGTTGEAAAVSAAADTPVELVVDPSYAIRLEGRVLDAEKRPIAAATVRIAWQRLDVNGRPEDEGHATFHGCGQLFTDAEGRFLAPAVLRRGLEYRAEVSTPGKLLAITEFIDPVAWKTQTFGDIVLHAIPECRSVEGRAVDRLGKPVAGLRVFQTGDGPRRTEATTDETGSFHLSGVCAGPFFLLASGPHYPLQGMLVQTGGKPIDFIVRREGEPVERPLKTLAEPLAPSARREMALRLIEPLLPALKQGELNAEKAWLLGTLATVDPNRLSEFAKLPIFSEAGLGGDASYQAALTLVPEDLDEAFALAEAINEPHFRGRIYLAACDKLSDDERQRKTELLATALLHARAERDIAQGVELMGQIAERWLDLGEIERGTALLREGEKLAWQLPAPSEAAQRAHELAAHLRAYFAGSLARIDGPAAIKLSAGFTSPFADRYRIVVARGLAAHDPAAAERLLDELEFSAQRYPQALPVLRRMAAIDAERAARLARKCETDTERGYALGIVAHGVARRDVAQAEALLNEAFDYLERAAAASAGEAYAWEHPAVLAAALLPVAERIDPALVERYFWRMMALRSPRAARIGANHHAAVVAGALAIFVSRYNRDAARALAAPIAAQIQPLAGDGDYWTTKLAWASLAVVDAAWAESLLATLPNPPPLVLRGAKNVGRRSIAEALAPSADGWRHKLYGLLPSVRDPDARDDER